MLVFGGVIFRFVVNVFFPGDERMQWVAADMQGWRQEKILFIRLKHEGEWKQKNRKSKPCLI